MFKFRKIKNVTIPQIKIEKEKEYYLRIDTAITKAPDSAGRVHMEDGKTAGKMPSPELIQVTNLENGEQGTVIVNTVLGRILNDNYPDHTYVGKSFCIVRHELAGKKYATFDLAEIEVETGGATEIEEKKRARP